jgi:hypothetical protein
MIYERPRVERAQLVALLGDHLSGEDCLKEALPV